MGLLLTLPLLLPLGSSLLLFATRHNRRASHLVAITSATVLLMLVSGLTLQVARDGLLVVAIGSWPPPYGIVLVADLLSVLMLLVCTLVAWATVL
ncbi:MAG: Na+/H+ antiporter subunit D, partial [Thermomicrobium sp.]|nr:Na+/H+ antiporter subunit D [Thermomicrobium sp.]